MAFFPLRGAFHKFPVAAYVKTASPQTLACRGKVFKKKRMQSMATRKCALVKGTLHDV